MKPPATPKNISSSRGQTPSASMTFSPLLPAFTVPFAMAIFVLDSLTKIDVTIAVLYVVVVLMSASFCTRREVLVVSGACMALTVLTFAIMRSTKSSLRYRIWAVASILKSKADCLALSSRSNPTTRE
jgi:hypothetical protein